MNQCHIFYGGYRAWILVLRVVVPIVLLMIVMIVVACLQHKRDPTGQLQSSSIDHHSIYLNRTLRSFKYSCH